MGGVWEKLTRAGQVPAAYRLRAYGRPISAVLDALEAEPLCGESADGRCTRVARAAGVRGIEHLADLVEGANDDAGLLAVRE
jgi:hypothetical protein